MRPAKKRRLEANGWTVADTRTFLDLTPEESALIDMRLALAHAIRSRRTALRLTQTVLARRIGSSQSRVAKLEAGDPNVSLDLLVRAFLALGASRKEVGAAISRRVA